MLIAHTLTPMIALLALAFGYAGAGMEPDEGESAPSRPAPLLLADFDGEHPTIDEHSGEWRAVNDNIMGGRSLGGGVIGHGVMVFSGSTNTNGGGFSSIRAGDKRWDLSEFNALSARVRADGRRYVFHIRTGLRVSGSEVFYRGSFDTKTLIDAAEADDRPAPENAEWQTVVVPFGDFVPMIRGRDMSARIGPLDPAAVRGIGLMIDDGLDGPFRLEADWVMAVVASDASQD